MLFSEFALWSKWSSCSLTCGSGEKTRTRTCEENCDDVSSDQFTESKNCNVVNCPGYWWFGFWMMVNVAIIPYPVIFTEYFKIDHFLKLPIYARIKKDLLAGFGQVLENVKKIQHICWKIVLWAVEFARLGSLDRFFSGWDKGFVLCIELLSLLTHIEKGQAKPCEDYHANCESWASIGECLNNPNYMLYHCRLSCQQCGGKIATGFL